MEKAVASMVDLLYKNKQNMPDNDYITLMDNLKSISVFRPKVYDKKHVVRYKLTTDICFIDDQCQYEDIKKDVYLGSTAVYNQSDEDFNEDYERKKTIDTHSFFYCYSNEIIDKEINTFNEILRLVADSKKHTLDHYINPVVFQEHQREVQEYYYDYKNTWDSWIRLLNDDAFDIVDIKHINEMDDEDVNEMNESN